MTKDEARVILRDELSKWSARPYAELLQLLETRIELEGDGYTGCVYALWDDPSGGAKVLRLWAELSYSTWTSFVPVVECELIPAP
jgi:hypothetical protein